YFNCAGTSWTIGSARATLNAPTSPAIVAAGISAVTRFEGFDVLAPSPSAGSASSIGLLARNAPALTLANVKIQTGAAAAGVDAVAGATLTQAGTFAGSPLVGGVSNCKDGNGQSVDPSLNGGNGGLGGAAGTRIRDCTEGVRGGCIWDIEPP